MIRFEPESCVRWLDDLDGAAGALCLVASRWRRRRGYPLQAGLVAAALLLGPSVGI